MILGSVVRDFLLNTLVNWKEYLDHHRADQYSEQLEKILLFHAAFSNLYDESLRLKVKAIYNYFAGKLATEEEGRLLLFDYAPIIILHKILSDYAQDEDEWFRKLIHLSSSKASATRQFSARLICFYMNPRVDFKNEALGFSLKDLLIKNIYHNIEAKHSDNQLLLASLSFLPLPPEERKEIYLDLLAYAEEKESRGDFVYLQKILEPSEPLTNPFYPYLVNCQQVSLQALMRIEFRPDQTNLGTQLDLFAPPPQPRFYYHFDDPRLAYYLQ